MSNAGPEKKESAQHVHVLPRVPSTDLGFFTEYRVGIDGIELDLRPTNDPLDPLNFPKWEKRVTLGIVMFMSVLIPH